ncbi:MAG: hypothetical protein ACX98W_09755, partial [bacterium]
GHRPNLMLRFPGVPGLYDEITVPATGWHAAKDGPGTDRPPPVLGAHTDEVLRQDLGLEGADLEALRAEGVIR